MCMPVSRFLICTDTLICELSLSLHVPTGFWVDSLTLNMFHLAKLPPLACFSLTGAGLVESGLSPGLLTLEFLLMSLWMNRCFSRLLHRTFLVACLSRRLAALSEHLLSSGMSQVLQKEFFYWVRVKLSLLYGGVLIRFWFLRSFSHLSIRLFLPKFYS